MLHVFVSRRKKHLFFVEPQRNEVLKKSATLYNSDDRGGFTLGTCWRHNTADLRQGYGHRQLFLSRVCGSSWSAPYNPTKLLWSNITNISESNVRNLKRPWGSSAVHVTFSKCYMLQITYKCVFLNI